MKEDDLDDVFKVACETVIDGMTSESEEAAKHKPAFVKRALELLAFAGHEVAFEHNEEVRSVASSLELVNSEQHKRPLFDDEKEEGYG